LIRQVTSNDSQYHPLCQEGRAENRFGAQAPLSPFLNFLKSIKYFRKKYLHVANDEDYKSANFQYNISCISGATRKDKYAKISEYG
jgi:hypothetical protein